MKRLTVLLTLAVFLVAANASAQMAPAGKGKPNPKPPTVFVDDFSDGNLDGWYVDEGNWTVQDGALVIRRVDQYDVSDYKLILVDNLEVGTFSLEVWLNPVNDSGAIAFWRQGWPTQVEVGLSSYWNTLRIGEVVNTEVISAYDYGDNDGVRWQPNTWYKVRIDANSRTGRVKVWVDDVYRFTHTVQVIQRSGKIGLHSGSFGSDWDNFYLQWRK